MSIDLELQELARVYRLVKGVNDFTSEELATWAIDTGRYIPKPVDPKMILARRISEAMRTEFITDRRGRRVRLLHSVTEPRDGKTQTRWYDMRTASPEKMRISAVQRRNGIIHDCKQMKWDFDSYNEFYNPGEPILIPLDFTPDVEELSLLELSA